MNAQALPTPPAGLTAVLIQNVEVLRALADGPIQGPAQVAKASGLPSKNIGRQLELMVRDGAIELHLERGYELTATGRRALRGMDLAAGRLEEAPPAPAAAVVVADNDVLLLAHDQLRRNPLQPRKHFDPEALEQLKAAIVAAGDVLHTLVVFPADEDGVHVIFDGERRWRAIGELIAEGMWPPGRRLRAIQRNNTPGQAAFIGLVTNNPTAKLSLLEQARAYETLVADTGWSARNAALQTGRDPRTVQEMLKVLKEAHPADIDAHQAGDLTWEELRGTVRERQEGEAAPEPEPRDLEEIAATPAAEADDPLVVAGVRYPNATRAAEARRLMAGGGPVNSGAGSRAAPKTLLPAEKALDPIETLALVELAHKRDRHGVEPTSASGRLAKVRRYWLDQSASELRAAGLVDFTHGWSGGPHAGLTFEGKQKLRALGVDIGVVMDQDLAAARARAGHAGFQATDAAPYVTPWLNDSDPAAPEARPAAPSAGIPTASAECDDEADDQGPEVRAAVTAALANPDGLSRETFAQLLELVGWKPPFMLTDVFRGCVFDGEEAEVATCDVNGELDDDLAHARALLIGYALNAFGPDAVTAAPLPSIVTVEG